MGFEEFQWVTDLAARPNLKWGTTAPAQTNSRYDLSKLTKEEWEEYKRMKRKTLVSPDEG